MSGGRANLTVIASGDTSLQIIRVYYLYISSDVLSGQHGLYVDIGEFGGSTAPFPSLPLASNKIGKDFMLAYVSIETAKSTRLVFEIHFNGTVTVS